MDAEDLEHGVVGLGLDEVAEGCAGDDEGGGDAAVLEKGNRKVLVLQQSVIHHHSSREISAKLWQQKYHERQDYFG